MTPSFHRLRRRRAHPLVEGNPSAPPRPSVFPELPSGVRGWIGALSAGAVLVVMGFIAKLSVQQFLGIETGSWSAQDLGLFAGRWAADTLTVTLGKLFDHPILLGLPLLAFLSPAILLAVLPEDHQLTRRLTFLSTGMSVVGLAIVLWWCEMPTVQMNDWLTTSLGEQLPKDGAPRTRVSELRLTRLVAAMDGVADTGRTTCTELPDSRQVDPPDLVRHLSGHTPATDARDSLQVMYACTVLVCIGVWLSFYLHAPVDEPKLMDEIFRGLRLVVLLAMLPIASCFVPYMYGKLICSTSLPLATVSFTKGKESAPAGERSAPAAPEKSAKQPSGGAAKTADEKGADPQPENNQFLLVDTQEKEVALIAVSDDPPALQRWPRERIDHIEQFGNRDAFNEILQHCNWLPAKTTGAK